MIPYLATIFALVVVTKRQLAKTKKDKEVGLSIEK
jgi:ABC-type uncharacterized transport system permease subunit